MKDLTEAYKEVYQLDEVSFANVGSLASNVMKMPGATPPKKDEKPATTPATPAATPTPAAAAPVPSAMDQWAKAHPKLAAAAAERARIRGTSETDNPLMKDMKANLPAPTKAQDPNFQSIMKSGKTGDQGYQSLTQNPNVRATAPTTSTSQNGTSAASQAAQASINNDPRAQAFDTSKYGFAGQSKTTPITPKKPLLRTPQMNSYDYGNIDPEQLTSLLNAYNDVYKAEVVEDEVEDLEEKRGLWDNIHAKRKRGEAPAKPGEKGYPKTLNVEENELEEGLKQARKNVGAGKCWDGYKAQGTKMNGGEEVPDCKKEAYDIILDYLMTEEYATNLKDAEKIMMVMSDAWMQEILEDWNA